MDGRLRVALIGAALAAVPLGIAVARRARRREPALPPPVAAAARAPVQAPRAEGPPIQACQGTAAPGCLRRRDALLAEGHLAAGLRRAQQLCLADRAYCGDRDRIRDRLFAAHDYGDAACRRGLEQWLAQGYQNGEIARWSPEQGFGEDAACVAARERALRYCTRTADCVVIQGSCGVPRAVNVALAHDEEERERSADIRRKCPPPPRSAFPTALCRAQACELKAQH